MDSNGVCHKLREGSREPRLTLALQDSNSCLVLLTNYVDIIVHKNPSFIMQETYLLYIK